MLLSPMWPLRSNKEEIGQAVVAWTVVVAAAVVAFVAEATAAAEEQSRPYEVVAEAFLLRHPVSLNTSCK